MTDVSFWPVSLGEWLTIAGVIVATVIAVWRFVRQPIMDKVNGFGDRLNEHVGDSKKLDGRLGAVERTLSLSEADRSNLHESIGRLTTEMQTLMKLTQRAEVSRAEDLGEIRERLVRIETKVDMKKEEQ